MKLDAVAALHTPPAANMQQAKLAADADDQAMRAAAKSFEAVFLTEMLAHAGLNKPPSLFSGGAGEDAFNSFLTREYANALVEAESVGLADQIYKALKERAGTDV